MNLKLWEYFGNETRGQDVDAKVPVLVAFCGGMFVLPAMAVVDRIFNFFSSGDGKEPKCKSNGQNPDQMDVMQNNPMKMDGCCGNRRGWRTFTHLVT